MSSDPTVEDYRKAIGILSTIAEDVFRGTKQDARENGEDPLLREPHELRAAAAATVRLVECLHDIAVGIADNVRLAKTENYAGDWESAEVPSDEQVELIGEPTRLRDREPPRTRDEVLGDWRANAIEDLEYPALQLAAVLGEARPLAADVLKGLRSLTSREAYQFSTGLQVGFFQEGYECPSTGYWTYRREQQPAGHYKTVLVEPIHEADIKYRPLPVEQLGTELDYAGPIEERRWLSALTLDSPEQLASPADHGWTLDPKATYPEGATEPSWEKGLHEEWSSADGQHQLSIFWISRTRITRAHYDGHGLPLDLHLINFVITGSRS